RKICRGFPIPERDEPLALSNIKHSYQFSRPRKSEYRCKRRQSQQASAKAASQSRELFPILPRPLIGLGCADDLPEPSNRVLNRVGPRVAAVEADEVGELLFRGKNRPRGDADSCREGLLIDHQRVY